MFRETEKRVPQIALGAKKNMTCLRLNKWCSEGGGVGIIGGEK